MTYIRLFRNHYIKLFRKQIRNTSSKASAVDLAYEIVEDDRSRTSSANPIIISHGVLGQRNNWRSVSKCLQTQLDPPRKIIIIDNRNHGTSPHTSEHSYELMTQDNLRLYDTLGLNEAVLLGHSMGGRSFMHTALTNPDKVSSLIVVDISPIVENKDVILAEPLKYLKTMHSIDLDGQAGTIAEVRSYADKQLKGSISSPPMRQFLLQNLTINPDKSFGWKVNLPTLIRDFENFRRLNFEKLHFNKPTLFINGELSTFVPKSHAKPIRSIFSNASIEYVPETHHLVHMEDTATFCELVANFLKNNK